MTPTRIFVIDDSPLFREMLRGIVEADGDIVVVGEAASGEEAIARVASLVPDLVTVDIEMPGVGGLETIAQLMMRRPVPILVLTGQPTGEGSSLAFDAIGRGALEIASKSSLGDDDGRGVRQLIKQLGTVRVVRHLGPQHHPPVRVTPALRVPPPRGCFIVGMAASSGGPSAIVEVLGALPPDFPGCVALVQHLPNGFMAPFERFLAERLELTVAVVHARTLPRPGTLLLPADDRHLLLADDGAFVVSDTPPLGGHRPSATRLFESLARVEASRAVGVILSGMGDDGAAGLLALKRTGAETVAQNEATSAIYGMPRAAVERGAATQVLPLGSIAALLCRLAVERTRPS
ncbi:MAG: response regulator receiver modulated CheB methylesterase [Myxococcales bacterium]|nr:response regulator receiver modulated CheB methylesterase [Myxococcales bacterium]